MYTLGLMFHAARNVRPPEMEPILVFETRKGLYAVKTAWKPPSMGGRPAPSFIAHKSARYDGRSRHLRACGRHPGDHDPFDSTSCQRFPGGLQLLIPTAHLRTMSEIGGVLFGGAAGRSQRQEVEVITSDAYRRITPWRDSAQRRSVSYRTIRPSECWRVVRTPVRPCEGLRLREAL